MHNIFSMYTKTMYIIDNQYAATRENMTYGRVFLLKYINYSKLKTKKL